MAEDGFPHLKSILDNDGKFRKCFRVFLDRLREKELKYEDWLTCIVNNYQGSIMECVDPSSKRAMRALGVGSGTGMWEDFLLSILKPQFEKVVQRLVEPNKDLLAEHKKNASQNNLQGVTYDWRSQTLEDYMNNVRETGSGKETKFHLISVFHSLYHFTNPEESIGFLYDQLEDGGILFINLCAESSIIAQISSLVPQRFNGCFSYSSRVVLDYLDSKGIPYDLYRRNQALDVSGCLDDRNSVSEEASLLMDFLTHVQDFLRASLPQGIREGVFLTMREMTDASGTQEVDQSSHVIVVQRKTREAIKTI